MVSLVVAVADYAASFAIESDSALDAARQCLMDALARGFEALRHPECASLIGPLVPGAMMPGGARVPGTSLELDPAQAAFCLGMMLGYSPRGEHGLELPDDRAAASLGALLATADYRARKATMEGKSPPAVHDVLGAIVKALEIQGVLALALQSRDPCPRTATLRFARVAVTAVATAQLGGTSRQIVSALSYACLESAVPPDADETGEFPQGDWATADAVSRAVRHACQAMASGRSSHATARAFEAVDLTGRLRGARSSTPARPLGTEVIDRLASRRSPQEIAGLASRFQSAVDRHFPARQAERVKALFAAPARLHDLPVNELLAALVTNGAR